MTEYSHSEEKASNTSTAAMRDESREQDALVAAAPTPDDSGELSAFVDGEPMADAGERLASADGAGSSAQCLHADKYRAVTPSALSRIRALVDEQAEDGALWAIYPFGEQPVAEAYLQQELRRLHALIEEVTS